MPRSLTESVPSIPIRLVIFFRLRGRHTVATQKFLLVSLQRQCSAMMFVSAVSIVGYRGQAPASVRHISDTDTSLHDGSLRITFAIHVDQLARRPDVVSASSATVFLLTKFCCIVVVRFAVSNIRVFVILPMPHEPKRQFRMLSCCMCFLRSILVTPFAPIFHTSTSFLS